MMSSLSHRLLPEIVRGVSLACCPGRDLVAMLDGGIALYVQDELSIRDSGLLHTLRPWMSLS